MADRGSSARLVNLLISGLVCGVLWEFWNYWSGAKWHYTVPIMEHVKIFEMPLPGYSASRRCRRMLRDVRVRARGVLRLDSSFDADDRRAMALPRHALVLTAGLGTRLRPLTLVRAKPAIPVAGEPMIRRIVAWLAGHGVDRARAQPASSARRRCTAVLGDGGDPRRARALFVGAAAHPRQRRRPALALLDRRRRRPFFIVNGDTLTDVDLAALADAHSASRRAGHAGAGAEPRVRCATAACVLDADGRVTGFVSARRRRRGSYHFIGVQVVERPAFDAAPAGRPTSARSAASTIG